MWGGPSRLKPVDGTVVSNSWCVFVCAPHPFRLCRAASLRAELNHLHAAAIEHLKHVHMKENAAAKRELDKVREQNHKKVAWMVCAEAVRSPNSPSCPLLRSSVPSSLRFQEQELLVRVSDLEAEMCSRSNRITDLDHEIHALNQTIDTLTRELELKGKEVLRVRSEANHQIRSEPPPQRNAAGP